MIKLKILCIILFILVSIHPGITKDNSIINISNRLDLFVDSFLIDTLINARLKLHEPKLTPLSENPPGRIYVTVIKDGDIYRMYSRGGKSGGSDGNLAETTLYFESQDGISWFKPNLGLFEVDGTRNNNVILAHDPPFSHNFCPFLDTKPDIPKQEKFKALAGIEASGLVPFISSDGIHWKKLREEPVITKGMFDSQNVSFWSEHESCYICYFRTWTGKNYEGLRTISRTTSKDFLHWTEPIAMNPNDEGEHLYTNGTHPYFRAPHIYIALPTRFLPERGNTTDIVFMTSRGGNKYDRTFMETFIRPGLDPKRWTNRANYAALNVVPTSETEMSIYMRERRFTLRTDGFVSVNAPYHGGEIITRSFIFDGDSLVINFSTAASGNIQIEIQDQNGLPIPGFTLKNCPQIIGDKIEKTVSWENRSDLSDLSGKPIRLRFVMKDADLYSIRFK